MLIGLIGKPNCGKSTFFKASTLANVEIGNRPFVTIAPHHGVGYVKIDCIDKEFGTQCNPRTGFCINHMRFVPVDLMDVAGLVEGASEGKGLGNQFLDDLRQADAFIQIIDVSGTTDSGGKEGKGDPVLDIKMLENELDLWYLGIFKKVWKTFSRSLQQNKENFAKAVAKQFSGLKVTEDHVKKTILQSGLNSEKAAQWTDVELKKFARSLRELTKPMIIAANKIDKPLARQNYDQLRADFPHRIIIPCSADSELALREAAKAGLINYVPGERDFKINHEKLNDKQKKALESIKENVLDIYTEGTGVQSILNSVVFSLLKYLAVFPAGASKLADSKGNVLPDCYLLPEGSTALDFAATIHTDFAKNFVKAIDARSKKALGKNYILKHRDAMEIVTK
jgi:ribosome-binding ATPase